MFLFLDQSAEPGLRETVVDSPEVVESRRILEMKKQPMQREEEAELRCRRFSAFPASRVLVSVLGPCRLVMARFSGFFTFLTVLLPLHFTRGSEVSVSAAVGQDCVLPCSGPEELKVSVLEWTVLKRIQLDQGRDLLIYRAGKVLKGYEHPDYTDRVQLLDPQLQSGDLSVLLKNVTFNDTGTYRCLTLYKDGQEKASISHLIRLNVTEQEQDRGTHGLIIGLSVLGLVAVIAITATCAKLKSSKQSHCCSENTGDHSSQSVSSPSAKALLHRPQTPAPPVTLSSLSEA